jgi:hypothetical protein
VRIVQAHGDGVRWPPIPHPTLSGRCGTLGVVVVVASALPCPLSSRAAGIGAMSEQWRVGANKNKAESATEDSEPHQNNTEMEQQQKKVTAKDKLKQIWTNINDTLKGGKKLYHCTSEQNAQSIEREGFRPGSQGIAGGGIYFAETPADAVRKAHNHGAVLKCRVKLGKVLDVAHEGDSSLTSSEVKRLGCNSVRIPRYGAEYDVQHFHQCIFVTLCLGTACTSHRVPEWSAGTKQSPHTRPAQHLQA